MRVGNSATLGRWMVVTLSLVLSAMAVTPLQAHADDGHKAHVHDVPGQVAKAVAGGLIAAAGADVPDRTEPTLVERYTLEQPRAQVPQDVYALANGCYAIQSLATGGWVERAGNGFAATASTPDAAESFFFKATDLAHYMIYGTDADWLAIDPGLLGELPDPSDVNALLGPFDLPDLIGPDGGGIHQADEPSPLADWKLIELDDGFRLKSIAGPELIDDGGTLSSGAPGTDVTFRLVDGCAEFPEVTVNIDGAPMGGENQWVESRGYADLHLHGMAFQFIGGEGRCGRPWHRYGVAYALVDCPDHEPGGRGAIMEQILSGDAPGTAHDTTGWPDFGYWPRYNSLTHEQGYWKWLERAWRGGLRLMVNLLVENQALCQVYQPVTLVLEPSDPAEAFNCNEMDSVRAQRAYMQALQDYIDAQNGGPGEGWYRIVDDPFEARQVINEGRLAVVPGIEISLLFNCEESVTTESTCTEEEIDAQLAEVIDMGVSQMEIVNKFDNGLSGVKGDGGTTGILVNGGQFIALQTFWDMRQCPEGQPEDEHDHSPSSLPVLNEAFPPEQQDVIFGAALEAAAQAGQDLSQPSIPSYGEGPHCNSKGMTEQGLYLLRRMAEEGILYDPDHQSLKGRNEGLAFMRDLDYGGVMTSHSWSTPSTYQQVYDMGGVNAPYAGGAEGFVGSWEDNRAMAADRCYFGFQYGSDVNGFGAQGGPRGSADERPLTYPFTGFGGVTVNQQQSGNQVYDLNTDGVDHYGLYVDWWKDLEVIAGKQITADMERGVEMYLQLWERARGVPGENCCRTSDGTNLAALADVEPGATREEILFAVGQPFDRTAGAYVYCVTTADGVELVELEFADNKLVAAPDLPDGLAATGGGSNGWLALAALLFGAAGLSARRRIA